MNRTLFFLFSFFFFSYCSAQKSKISYNGENTFFISSTLFSELKINGKVSFEDIRKEESWELLIKKFGETGFTEVVSDSLFGNSRIDDFGGLRIYYSEIEDPSRLLANRVEIDNTSFSLMANNFELTIGEPINKYLPAEMNNSMVGESYLVLQLEYEKDKYADIESIGIKLNPNSGVIKSMRIILWRP